MKVMVRMARKPSGADFPATLTFRSCRMTGWPISETMKATMMYTSTLRKYQHRNAASAKAAAYRVYRASLSVLLSFIYIFFTLARKLRTWALYSSG